LENTFNKKDVKVRHDTAVQALPLSDSGVL
jgi:hypothetical protein